MKTEVIMLRAFFGDVVSQKSKSEFLSATDLFRIGNKYLLINELPAVNIKSYFAINETKKLIKKIEDRYGIARVLSKGKGHHTWVHPVLFMDMAFWINPELKLEAYEWMYDHLLRYRNSSGDSYRKMVGSIDVVTRNKSLLQNNIKETARKIKASLGVEDWNTATEEQLNKRDKIHETISTLSHAMRDLNAIIELAIRINNTD